MAKAKKIKFSSGGESKAFKRGFAIGAEVCRTKGAAGIRSHKGGGVLIAKTKKAKPKAKPKAKAKTKAKAKPKAAKRGRR